MYLHVFILLLIDNRVYGYLNSAEYDVNLDSCVCNFDHWKFFQFYVNY